MIILFKVIIIISIIKILIGGIFFYKNPEKYFFLIINSFSGIFLFFPIFLCFFNDNNCYHDSLPFIIFGALFYIISLIFMCANHINKKKVMIYQETQNKISKWK